MSRSWSLLLLLALVVSEANAYGRYDPKRILTVAQTSTGSNHSVDVGYLDQILNDLKSHAEHYPPQFNTLEEKNRAIRDVVILSRILDVLVNGADPDREVLLRCGLLHSLAHNLDVPGAVERANAIFAQVLEAKPDDPRGNYLYGSFMASAGRPYEALMYLRKARKFGVADAAYAIGIIYLSLGDEAQALTHLEDYHHAHPDGESAGKLIAAIRNGEMELARRRE